MILKNAVTSGTLFTMIRAKTRVEGGGVIGMAASRGSSSPNELGRSLPLVFRVASSSRKSALVSSTSEHV